MFQRLRRYLDYVRRTYTLDADLRVMSGTDCDWCRGAIAEQEGLRRGSAVYCDDACHDAAVLADARAI